jgi:hypothetical protein
MLGMPGKFFTGIAAQLAEMSEALKGYHILVVLLPKAAVQRYHDPSSARTVASTYSYAAV